LPPKAAELFQKIQLAHRNRGSNPLISERRTWFEFLRVAHAGSNLRLTGGELYVLLTEEYGWRNDLAQSLAAESTLPWNSWIFWPRLATDCLMPTGTIRSSVE